MHPFGDEDDLDFGVVQIWSLRLGTCICPCSVYQEGPDAVWKKPEFLGESAGSRTESKKQMILETEEALLKLKGGVCQNLTLSSDGNLSRMGL